MMILKLNLTLTSKLILSSKLTLTSTTSTLLLGPDRVPAPPFVPWSVPGAPRPARRDVQQAEVVAEVPLAEAVLPVDVVPMQEV